MQTLLFLQAWEEGRSRFTNQLSEITESDLMKKLPPSPNSVGFILRHICDVELLFAKNVFGAKEISVHASTVIEKRDTGKWKDLKELMEYERTAFEMLRKVIRLQPHEAWEERINTLEFGTKTRAQALARIISHTAYHSGQLAMLLKYGT